MHNYTLLLDQVTAALALKGYVDPQAMLMFRDSDGYTQIRLEFDYKVRESDGRTYGYVRDYSLVAAGRDPSAVMPYIDTALEMVAELPTVREAAIKAFINDLERLKGDAADLGLEADFVNPLAAIMEKLATNALPAPKN